MSKCPFKKYKDVEWDVVTKVDAGYAQWALDKKYQLEGEYAERNAITRKEIQNLLGLHIENPVLDDSSKEMVVGSATPATTYNTPESPFPNSLVLKRLEEIIEEIKKTNIILEKKDGDVVTPSGTTTSDSEW